MNSLAWRPYTQMKTAPPPLQVVRTYGATLDLSDGRTLVDGIASWWTACHGYNHPKIIEAVQQQAAQMPHVMFGGLSHQPAEELCQQLAGILPGDLQHCFLAESGSVSVEVALKMALQYWLNQGQKNRSRFICFEGGYHGDTLGTMAVCDPEEGMHQRFSGILAQHHVLPVPRTAALLDSFEQFVAAKADSLAGVIVEPLLQAAGGMLLHSPEVLDSLVRMARKHGLLVIFDEIATGFYRTGSLFACQQGQELPDIICLSKALSGGVLPLSAAVATPQVFSAFWSDDPEAALMHGPTFMGNPCACAAALASLQLFGSNDYAQKVSNIESLLRRELSGLASHPQVKEVRILGAMGAVECRDTLARSQLSQYFVEQGCWIRPLEQVIYLMPPLTISESELGQLTEAINSAFSQGPLAQ